MDTTIDNATFSITVPDREVRIFKQIAKKFGWNVGKRKKAGIKEALDDVKAGRVSDSFSSSEELFKSLGVNV